jgi:XTP/dITP diphosphohydrolase
MSAAVSDPSKIERLLICGTGNRKKGAELAELLGPFGFTLKTLADYPQAIEVDEAGASFAENAALKATRQAAHLNTWVLADDSGLVVDALDGRPGIYSARFAGPGATDALNRRKLLDELAGVVLARRTAHFACHVALADPTGQLRAEASGACHGRIIMDERGAHGFGYDPLFEVVEYHRTFGELGPAVKTVLSHRARAIEALLPALLSLAAGEWGARG